MKSHGCVMDFVKARNKDVMRAYRHLLAKSKGPVNLLELAGQLVNMPAERFWVSEQRAAIVVSELMRGRPLPLYTRPTKREMYLEILRRYKELRKTNPNASIIDLTTMIVYSPAPKFYMAPRFAMEIIYKVVNGFYERQQRY